MELGLLPGLLHWPPLRWAASRSAWSLDRRPHQRGRYVARGAVYFPSRSRSAGLPGVSQAPDRAGAREPGTRLAPSSRAPPTQWCRWTSGLILAWNPVAEEMFGWRPDEVLGKDLAEPTMPPRIQDLMREGKRRFLEDDDAAMIGRRFESRALTRDGRQFPIEVSISAVRESDHWLFHVFSTTSPSARPRRRSATGWRASSPPQATRSSASRSTAGSRAGTRAPSGSTATRSARRWRYPCSTSSRPDRPDDVAPQLKTVQEGDRIVQRRLRPRRQRRPPRGGGGTATRSRTPPGRSWRGRRSTATSATTNG